MIWQYRSVIMGHWESRLLIFIEAKCPKIYRSVFDELKLFTNMHPRFCTRSLIFFTDRRRPGNQQCHRERSRFQSRHRWQPHNHTHPIGNTIASKRLGRVGDGCLGTRTRTSPGKSLEMLLNDLSLNNPRWGSPTHYLLVVKLLPPKWEDEGSQPRGYS